MHRYICGSAGDLQGLVTCCLSLGRELKGHMGGIFFMSEVPL